MITQQEIAEMNVAPVSSILPADILHERLTTYDELDRIVSIILAGSYNLTMLIGRKGNGKTRSFENVIEEYERTAPRIRIRMVDGKPVKVGEDEVDESDDDEDGETDDEGDIEEIVDMSKCRIAYLNNAASAVGLYTWAYHNRDKILVIDDVRKLFKDDGAITVLMALCNTNPVKRVFWETQNKTLEKNNIPKSFKTKSSVVIINNSIDGIQARLEPLLDRGRTFLFDPSKEELHAQAKTWVKDKEVYQWVSDNLTLMPYPSFRWYTGILEEKRANEVLPPHKRRDWRQWILNVWSSLDPAVQTFVEVQHNPALANAAEPERIEEFVRLGRLRNHPASRATWFRYKKDYPHQVRKENGNGKSAPAEPRKAATIRAVGKGKSKGK